MSRGKGRLAKLVMAAVMVPVLAGIQSVLISGASPSPHFMRPVVVKVTEERTGRPISDVELLVFDASGREHLYMFDRRSDRRGVASLWLPGPGAWLIRRMCCGYYACGESLVVLDSLADTVRFAIMQNVSAMRTCSEFWEGGRYSEVPKPELLDTVAAEMKQLASAGTW